MQYTRFRRGAVSPCRERNRRSPDVVQPKSFRRELGPSPARCPRPKFGAGRSFPVSSLHQIRLPPRTIQLERDHHHGERDTDFLRGSPLGTEVFRSDTKPSVHAPAKHLWRSARVPAGWQSRLLQPRRTDHPGFHGRCPAGLLRL